MSKKRNKKTRKDFSKKVLSIYKSTNDEYTYSEIKVKIKINSSEDSEALIHTLVKMVNSDILIKENNKYKVSPKSVYIGKISINSQTNGYVHSDDKDFDVFVANNNLNKSLDGDLVSVSYFKKPSGKYEGKVIEIIERSEKNYVGILRISDNISYVETQKTKMYTDIFIKNENVKGNNGDLVVVRILGWNNKSYTPHGEILNVIGEPGNNNAEIHTILAEYGLPYSFPQDVEDEANALDVGITEEEINKRMDYRNILTFTIDPDSAKDFDDALSFQYLENGNVEVGVHIADVSHYVKPGSKLDEEAYNRSTSIYLVDRVVPMLPEVLSNFACSLRPNEDKYTFSFIFEIDKSGGIISEKFGKGVINSNYRFAYEEAQYIIESCTKGESVVIPSEVSIDGTEREIERQVVDAILDMDNIAKILRSRRIKYGATVFDKSEVKFKLSETGYPVEVYDKVSKDANKLIEEFMLLANRRTSEYVTKSKKSFIYRIHDEPVEERLLLLQENVAKFGYTLKLNNKKEINESLNNLLQEVSGTQEQNFIDTLVVRCMSKAVYSSDNIGHYGLAFDYYSHMTSPIRRYSDVIGHRLLEKYLNGEKSIGQSEIENRCQHINNMEGLAVSAERDSIKYMQTLYMSNYKNHVFQGVITGVTERGLFVEIVNNKCEGMIRLKDLTDDTYNYNDKTYSLTGRRSGKVLRLGDSIMVTCSNVDLDKRQIDFKL